MAALSGSSLSAAPAVAAPPAPAVQRANKAAATTTSSGSNRCEVASPMPDLSHLTEEERRIIESVLMRQRLEEEQETEIVRRQADEVQLLEEAIRQRSEHQRKAGAELDATCQLCLKTKFADGLGHACHYCNARCCARCGGKVALRSSKVIWVCILCRKKQELVVKTGKWILPSGAPMQQQQGGSGSGGASHLMINDKRPRLERAVSYERDNSGGGGVRPGVSSMSSSCAYGTPSSGAPTHAPLQRSGSLQSHGPSSWRPLPSDVNPLASRGITTADYGSSSGNVGSSSSALRQPGSLGGINPAGGNRDMTCRRSNSSNAWASQDSWSEYGRESYGDNGGKAGAHPSQDPQTQSSSQQLPVAKRGLAGRSNSYDYDPYHQDDYGRNRADMMKSGASMSSGNLKDRNLPPQPLHHHHLHHRHRHPHHHHQRQPQSSSEDELRSTSECTSCEDVEVESESVSEKGEMDSVNDRSWPANQTNSRNQANRGGRFKSQTLAHPVTWQPNSDGTKMIGRMILNKNMSASLTGSGGGAPGQQQAGMSSNPSSASILGLKVVGGKRVDNGRLAAIVEKVKRGSIADSIGHLRPGDEVLEWNGQPLQGRTFEEVYDIITESRADQEIEIIVSRPISDVGRPSSLAGSSGSGSGQHGQMHGSTERGYLARSGSLRSGGSKARDRPAVTVTSPASPETLHPSWGKVQVKLWYDTATQQLSVTIVGAFDLPPRPNGALRNPYAKLFLLPDKSEKSKRRTRALASTLEPRWNQTFLYSNLRRSELRSRFLEITVWDSDRLDTGRLIGEVVVDLSAAPLDGEADWYTLTSHEESIQILRRAGLQMVDSVSSPVGSVDHLSPPSTSSRLSDSEPDPSDPGDGDDGGGGMGHGHHRSSRHSRAMERGGRSDGASVSSMGSSSSPPLDSEYPDHRRSRQRSGTLVAADDLKYGTGMGSRGAILDRSRQRSHSAAPTEISDHHRSLERTPSGRSRSKSPRRISEPGRRSLSPSEERLPGDAMRGGGYGGGAPRLTSRSATATPTGSPKRRHLPQIPAALQQTSFSRVRQDVEDRARMLKLRMGPTSSYSVASAGSSRSWRSYSGHSDNDLPPPQRQSSVRGSGTSSQGHKGNVGHSSRGMRSGASASGGKILSPDREGGPGGGGDSDVESMVSFVSGTSALSTQSERPSAYSKRTGDRRVELLDRNQDVGGAAGDGRSGSSFRRNQLGRSLSQSDVPVTEKNDGSLSDTALNSGILDAPDRSVTWRRGGAGGSASSGMQHYGGKSDKSGGLSKKSNSTSQLSATACESGRKRKLGFGRKEKNAFTVHRSEEVMPTVLRHLVRQSSSLSSEGGSGGGLSGAAASSTPATSGPSRSSSRSLLASRSLSVDLNDVDEFRDQDGYEQSRSSTQPSTPLAPLNNKTPDSRNTTFSFFIQI